jgi:DNA-binding LacI/PurR family transcriptional regulator
VFAESDEMAFGAMKTLRKRGLRVPQDVAVIGFDDHDAAELLDLSTVRQPVYAQGATVARALLAAAGGELGPQPAIVLPTELVIRGSTDPAHTVF